LRPLLVGSGFDRGRIAGEMQRNAHPIDFIV
jgi:hypothetical protein